LQQAPSTQNPELHWLFPSQAMATGFLATQLPLSQ
jgi:hypothetical protein